jgi:hypothetical protein
VLERVEERETLGSTGFGRGVAIPHARLETIPRPVAAFLRLEKPVDFASSDGMPVDCVFGLLSPEQAGATHLQALAEISRLMADGSIDGGMIPKMESCVEAITSGVSRCHILDGRIPHVLLIELFTIAGVGTMITSQLEEGKK